MAKILGALQPRPGGLFFDGTCGGGGHASAFLEATSPDGFLWACDRDPAALAAATVRLSRWPGRFDLRKGDFADATDWAPVNRLDGALVDLGVSSHQLDTAARGFSFQEATAPLDMRMDPSQRLTAAEIVNHWEEAHLERLLRENDEPCARRMAREIHRARLVAPFATCGQLAALAARCAGPRTGRKHPATRLFQALRIAVNGELDSLRRGLPAVFSLLRKGGRLAVISFHSGEDKLVKDFMRTECRNFDAPQGAEDQPHCRTPRPPRGKLVTRKSESADPEELEENPRARSARLRVVEKA